MRIFLIAFCLSWAFVGHIHAMTLQQAENIAISRANELKLLSDDLDAVNALGIAANQYPDPTLSLGALNFPVDSFSASQEPMTQLQIGLRQVIPKGDSLKYRYLSKRQKANAILASRKLQALKILQQVRVLWFDSYLWHKSEQLLLAQRHTFKHLEQVASSLFANNKVPQQDVLNAQLNLSQIDEQLITIRQAAALTDAKLTRWLGDEAISEIRVTTESKLANLLSYKQHKMTLNQHPFLIIDKALVDEAKAKANLVKQDYKPGFSMGVAYGFRQGVNNDNSQRPDFLTANLNVSMPLFVINRQDKTMLASEKKVSSAKEKYQLDYKELLKELSESTINYKKSQQSASLYRKKLLPQARQYAESTLIAYQNNQTDFLNVAQSHIRYLQLQLAQIKRQVNVRKAQINLLYLEGK